MSLDFHTGIDKESTITAALNLAISLRSLERWTETKALVRKVLPAAHRTLGRDDETTLTLKTELLEAIRRDDSSSLDELRKAISMCEESYRRARPVFGDSARNAPDTSGTPRIA